MRLPLLSHSQYSTCERLTSRLRAEYRSTFTFSVLAEKLELSIRSMVEKEGSSRLDDASNTRQCQGFWWRSPPPSSTQPTATPALHSSAKDRRLQVGRKSAQGPVCPIERRRPDRAGPRSAAETSREEEWTVSLCVESGVVAARVGSCARALHCGGDRDAIAGISVCDEQMVTVDVGGDAGMVRALDHRHVISTNANLYLLINSRRSDSLGRI